MFASINYDCQDQQMPHLAWLGNFSVILDNSTNKATAPLLLQIIERMVSWPNPKRRLIFNHFETNFDQGTLHEYNMNQIGTLLLFLNGSQRRESLARPR